MGNSALPFDASGTVNAATCGSGSRCAPYSVVRGAVRAVEVLPPLPHAASATEIATRVTVRARGRRDVMWRMLARGARVRVHGACRPGGGSRPGPAPHDHTADARGD